MILRLKSNQYYDFYNIKKIIVYEDFIEIFANFEKGRKYSTVKLREEMISEKSMKDLEYKMKQMTRFDFEGICPYCSSQNISIKERILRERQINNPRPKIIELDTRKEGYVCNTCNRSFTKEQLKYCDVVLYYK